MDCTGLPCLDCEVECPARTNLNRLHCENNEKERADQRLLTDIVRIRRLQHEGGCAYGPLVQTPDFVNIPHVTALTGDLLSFMIEADHPLRHTKTFYLIVLRYPGLDRYSVTAFGVKHPHIKNNAICFGTNESLANQLVREQRYPELAYFLASELSSFNPQSPWYSPICEKSFIASQDCLDCGQLSCEKADGITQRCRTLRGLSACRACAHPCNHYKTRLAAAAREKEQQLGDLMLLLRRENHWAARLEAPPLDKTPIYTLLRDTEIDYRRARTIVDACQR